MGLCRDNVTNYLAQLGFSVVRIPREDIKPLDIIGRDRDQMRLGTIDQLLVNPGANLPSVKTNVQAAEINGQVSSKLDAAIGVNILGSVLGALAGTAVKVKAAYKQAKKVQFEFRDVHLDTVAPLTVGQYLRTAEVDAENLVLQRYVLGKGQLFLITETLKSKSITVRAEDSQGTDVGLDVPAVKELLGAEAKIGIERGAAGGLTYSGDRELVFGFKCFRVGVEDGVLSLSAARPGEVAMAAGSGAPEFVLGAGLVDLDAGRLDATS